MNTMLYVGLIIAIALIVGLAIFTGAKKSTGKKSEGISAAVVAGLIMGTLVGGSSTVGTAQLAYNYGLSAWWFTLGGGIACLVLAFVYVKPLRAQGVPMLSTSAAHRQTTPSKSGSIIPYFARSLFFIIL